MIVNQGPIAHLTTNAWLSRLFTRQMLKMILMMRRNFTLGVSKTHLKQRFRNPKKECTHEKYQNSIELSIYIYVVLRANYCWTVWKKICFCRLIINIPTLLLLLLLLLNCFCGMVDQPKAFSLISSQDHCQRSSPLQISNKLWARYEFVQNLSSGVAEWSCKVVMMFWHTSFYLSVCLCLTISLSICLSACLHI